MKLKEVLGHISPVFDSNKRKQLVIDAISTSEQKNEGVINIHRYDATNVGDYFCAPHQYFDELKGKVLDISGMRKVSKKDRTHWIDTVVNNSLIIGGGGLLNLRHFEKQMQLFESLHAKGKKTVLWGPGHNEVNRELFGKKINYNVDLKNFGMAGVRDYSNKEHWVPCVSCMHTVFDQKFTETQEVGIIFSKKTLKDTSLLAKLENFPSTNNTTNLDDMVSFIGKSETLVTDSYHAMYWAMLLGKKTVVVPTTSKFYDFKYQPVVTSYEDFEDVLSQATAYSGVLEECRTVNKDYASKVFDYLNL
ncbi:MAG: polysaccharide pyruvyl transferase family protein [Bacteroidetes bacterium]|nr:polysaccharide pyruvyl transferase family protein [Bacteroidota bacterium]